MLAFGLEVGPPARSAPSAHFARIGPYGGTVRSLLISTRNRPLVYLGTNDGQIFRSADGGHNWKLLYPGLKRRQFVVHSIIEDESGRLIAGGWDLRSEGGGLFESPDRGDSWRQIPLPAGDVAVRAIAVGGGKSGRMIASTGAGLFLSQDRGKTWRQVGKQITAFRQAKSVAIDPRDPNLLLVGTWHLGYRSADFGKTWTQNSRGMLEDSDVFSMSIDPRDARTVFAGACSGFYRSVDRGATWTRLRAFPKSFQVRAQVVIPDPGGSGRVFGGTTEGLFLSRNSGSTWDRVTSSEWTVNAVQVDPKDCEVILIGTELHGVLRSGDGGRTWIQSNTGFVSRPIARVMSDPATPGRFLVGEQFDGKVGGFYLYDNPGDVWVKLNARDIPGVGLFSYIELPGKKGRIAGTARGAYLKLNPSDDWARLPGPIGTLPVYDLAASGAGGWIFAGTSDGVYRARLDELRFAKPPEYSFIPRVFSLIIFPGSSGSIFAGTHFGVIRSRDSGATWQFSTEGIPDHTTVESLASDPARQGHMLAGTTSGLFVSRDAGATWSRMQDSRLGAKIPAVIFLDSAGRRILAADGTFGGLFLSGDSGSHWERIENPEFGSPVRTMSMDPSDPSTLYLGTATEGVYRLKMQGF